MKEESGSYFLFLFPSASAVQGLFFVFVSCHVDPAGEQGTIVAQDLSLIHLVYLQICVLISSPGEVALVEDA
jgi:hypothetical protein